MKFYNKIYLHGKLITEFYFFFNSHTCSLGWINSSLQKIFFSRLTLSWRRPLSYRNQSIDLLRMKELMKQESCRSSHRIFQSFEVSNTHSIKILRRSVIKLLIMLLIKQSFVVAYWLVINICLKSVIGRNIW